MNNDQENNALLVNIFNSSCHDLWKWENWKFVINKVYTEKYKVAPDNEWSYHIFVWDTEFVEVTWEEKETFTWYWYASYKRTGRNGKDYMWFYLWEWKNWQRTWAWTIIYDDWDIYEWEVKNWMRHGKWRYTIIWGESYTWDWKDDAMDWDWTWIFENGEKYVWKLKEWKITWVWRFYYNNWEIYDWEWNDWKRNWWWFLHFPDWSLLYTKDWWKDWVADWTFLYQSPEWEKWIVYFKDWEQVQK